MEADQIQLEIVQFGDELGVILPEAALARHGLSDGDELYLRETAGGLVLSRATSICAEEVAIGESILRDYDETLRLLADSEASEGQR